MDIVGQNYKFPKTHFIKRRALLHVVSKNFFKIGKNEWTEIIGPSRKILGTNEGYSRTNTDYYQGQPQTTTKVLSKLSLSPDIEPLRTRPMNPEVNTKIGPESHLFQNFGILLKKV